MKKKRLPRWPRTIESDCLLVQAAFLECDPMKDGPDIYLQSESSIKHRIRAVRRLSKWLTEWADAAEARLPRGRGRNDR